MAGSRPKNNDTNQTRRGPAITRGGRLESRCRNVYLTPFDTLSNEVVRERYRSMGVEMIDMSTADFAAFLRADLEKWRKVAREANIVVE